MYSVVVHKANGTRLEYPSSADTDLARGAILKAAWDSLQEGDALYFHGNFQVNSQLTVPANNVSIIGSGWGTARLLSDSFNNTTTYSRIYINGKSGVTLKGFKVEQIEVAAGWNGYAFTSEGLCTNNIIDSVWFEKCHQMRIHSTTTTNNHFTVINCHFLNARGGGIKTNAGSEYCRFVNNLISGDIYNWAYAVVEYGGNNTWVGNHINKAYNGILLGAGNNHGHSVWTGGSINHCNLAGNAIETTNGHTLGYQFVGTNIFGGYISLYGCKGVRFTACNISANFRVNLAQPLSGNNYIKDCNIYLPNNVILDTTGAALATSSPTERAKIIVKDCLDIPTGNTWSESS